MASTKILGYTQLTAPVGTEAVVVADSASTNKYVIISDLIKKWFSTVDADGNNLTMGAGIIDFGPTPATGGVIKISINDRIGWRNVANTNNHQIGFDGSDDFIINIDAVTEYSFSATEADFNGNGIRNGLFFESSSADAALSGTIRLGNGDGIAFRNNANTGQFWVYADTNDALYFELPIELNGRELQLDGSGTSLHAFAGNMIIDVPTTKNFSFEIASVVEMTLNATDLDLLANNVRNFGFIESNATNPATVGEIRLGDNSFIAFRNGSNTANHFLEFTGSEVHWTGDDSQDEEMYFTMDRKSTSAGGGIGSIIWNDSTSTTSGLGGTNYAYIQAINQSWTNGSVQGSLAFLAAYNNNTTTFLSFNTNQDNKIDIFKETKFNNNLLSGVNYIQNNGANAAALGFIRMSSSSTIQWRNNGNTANIGIQLLGSDAIGIGTDLDVLGNDVNNIQNLIHDHSNSGTDIDFTEDELQSISIAANTTFTCTTYAIGKSKTLRITTDATLRTLTFPATWKFVGAKPADQAASKVGILTITCFTAAEAGAVAAYSVEA